MELSAKNQIEQLRTLLRDKESELSQRCALQQDIQEQLKSKDTSITDLENGIKTLKEKLSSMDTLSDQLFTALEQAKLVEPLNLELEKTKEELNSVNSSIQQLEEEANGLRLSAENYRNQALQFQEQLEEREKERENLKSLVDDLNHKVNENKEQLTSLEQETSEMKDLLNQKEKLVIDLQTKVEETAASTSAKELEWQRNTEEVTSRSHVAQSELQAVKLELDAKIQQIIQFEHAQNVWSTCESHFKTIAEEKDELLASKDSELDTLRRLLNDQGNSVSEVLEHRSKLERANEEISEKLATTEAHLAVIQETLDKNEEQVSELLQEKQQLTNQLYDGKSSWEQEHLKLVSSLNIAQSELEAMKETMDYKDHRILELEQSQSLWNTSEYQLKSLVEERTRESEMKQSQLEEIQQSLMKKEKQIIDLQLEIEMSLNHSKARDSEWQTKIEELSSKIERAQVEFDVLKTTCDASSDRVGELEQEHNLLIAEKFHLQSTIEEKEKLLASQEFESKTTLESLEIKDRRIAELDEEIVQTTCHQKTRDAEWEQKILELSNQVTAYFSELEEFRNTLSAKNERVLELEQVQNQWTRETSLLKAAVEENEERINAKESEIESLKKSLDLKEQCVNELQDQLQRTSQCLSMQDSELKQENKVLVESLKNTESELRELKVRLEATEDNFKQQESELRTIIEDKDRLLISKESELNERQQGIEFKDQRINSLQDTVDKLNVHLSTLTSESETKINELSVLLDTTQSELQAIKSTLQNKEHRIQQLEQEMINEENLTEQLAASELQLNTVKQSLCDSENKIAKLQSDRSVFESSSFESARLLAEKEAELETIQKTLKGGELRFTDLQEALSKADHKLENLESELQELRLLNVEQESKINSLEGSVEGATQHSALKDSELETLNHSLVVKESVILDLQEEVGRNGQLLSESQTLVEEQRQQLRLLKQSMDEKDALTEEFKNRLASGESEWRRTLADLNDRLSQVEQIEQELRLELAAKEEKIQEMIENQKITEDSSAIATSAIDSAVARAVELEVKLLSALDQVSQKDAEKELLAAECVKLKENFESSKIQTESVEQMENEIKVNVLYILRKNFYFIHFFQFKALKNEMSTLVEEKNRLEILCKRFKVQLADTRKLLSATKTSEVAAAKEIETAKSTQEEPNEAKTNFLVQAEQNENQLKVFLIRVLYLTERLLIRIIYVSLCRTMNRKNHFNSSSLCSKENLT